MKKVNEKGFTLAELLIVVAVIAVLVAVAIPTFTNQLEKSRQAVDVSNLRSAYAAARLAEMDGSVDNVKFDVNERHLRVGVDDEDESNAGTNAEKMYTSFWYDPDSGKLIAITDTADTTTGDPFATPPSYHTQDKEKTSGKAMDLFTKTSQLGKATGSAVLVDTKQLPGEGEKIVVYQDDQLERYEAVDPTTDKTVYHTGTVDKAIRVTFYHTMSDTFKLHEISFVMFANSPLYTEGSESEVIAKLSPATGNESNYSGKKLMTNANDSGVFSLPLADITIGGKPYDTWKKLYKVEVSSKTADFTTAPTLDSATPPTKVDGTLKMTTDATPAPVPAEMILTFTDKDDFTLTGTLKVKIIGKSA